MFSSQNNCFFAFLKYRIGNKGNMSMVIAGMDWRKAVFF